MKSIGIDLSLTATGLAVAADGEMDFRTLRYLGKDSGWPRYRWIIHEVLDYAYSYNQSRPDIVVIEGLSFGSNMPSAQERAGLHFAIREELDHRGVRIVLVAPTQLKKFVTGKGNSEKSAVMMYVRDRWGHMPLNDNEADAIVLAKIGRCLLGVETPSNNAQREVLAALSNPKEKRGRKHAR